MPNYNAVYRGRVVDANDPLGRCRVRVTIPDVLGQNSVWAEACVPFGAPRTPPPLASSVWVTFENGNPDFPVVLGVWPGG